MHPQSQTGDDTSTVLIYAGPGLKHHDVRGLRTPRRCRDVDLLAEGLPYARDVAVADRRA